MYRLSPRVESATPLPLRSSARFTWTAAYPGFANDGWAGLVRPGATLITPELLPVLGYDAERELTLLGTRAKHGLGERPARVRQPDALAERHDSVASAWRIVVEEDAAREVAAAGELEREERRGQRVRRAYRLTSAGAPPLYVSSAPYAVRQADLSAVRLRLFSHPAHTMNAAEWEKAARAAMEQVRTHLGEYGHLELRIVEVPHSYLEEPVAYGNLLLIPETEGWLHDYRKPPALDWIAYVTAREVAAGWLAQLAPALDAPGSILFTEGLSGAMGLSALEKTNPAGAEQYRRRLADRYLRASNLEDGREPALVDAGDAGDETYLADKAVLALDAARRQTGDASFARSLRAALPSRDPDLLVSRLEEAAPLSVRSVVHEWLRDVVVYDSRVKSAEASPSAQGWEVRAELNVQRFGATDLDNRAPLATKGQVLPVRVRTREQTLLDTSVVLPPEGRWRAAVTLAPASVHVDADALWLDRDRSNNRAEIRR